MIINLLCNLIIIVAIVGSIFLIYRFIIKSILDKYFDLKNKENKNELCRLYSVINPEEVRKELNDYIHQYTLIYVLYHFTVNKIEYIKQDDVDKMVKEITITINVEISELYIFYFRLLYDIQDDDSLTSHIHDLVKDDVMAFVKDFNAPR